MGFFMKYWKIFGSIVLGLAILFGVLFATPVLGPVTAQMCDDDGAFNLWAGQHNYAGNGFVNYSPGTPGTFSFRIYPACVIEKVDLGIYPSAGDMPDPPAPGSLQHHWDYGAGTSAQIDESFELTLASGTYYILLHADTVGCNGAYSADTAWACCNEITTGGEAEDFCPSVGDGNPWAYYFTFTIP
jgi:hypothetical protein